MDLESKNSFRQCLVSFAKTEGMTIILSSHEMQDIETICPRTLILKQGELIYDGITSQLGESTTRIFIFLDDSPLELPSNILEKCLDHNISRENDGVRLQLECRHQDVNFILRYVTMTWEPVSLEIRRTNLGTQVLNKLKEN